jgi:predicted DsbA family dithiol-disulfide isomerase
MPDTAKPVLLATVFSDYICPFCYIGDLRLDRLRERYDVRINWMLVEIHPETPPEGMPIDELGYSSERWQQMMTNLQQLAAEEGIELPVQTINANSHKALLLAEAAKEAGADTFYRLHRRLFEAYFMEGRNIGDEQVLKELADACDVPDEIVARAWREPRYEEKLQQNAAAAAQYDVRATPTVFFSEQQRLDGALPYERFIQAAQAGLAVQQQQAAQQ